MEHFKAFSKHDHYFAIADHVKTNGCNIKWEHFDILASGQIEFEVCYVTHGPRASNNLKGNETRFVTYSTRLENEVSKIFIIS